MIPAANRLLIRGGRVYDHDGDVHRPDIADILIEGSEITAVGIDLPREATEEAEVLDASGRLVVPGLINAHYHSHDTLCRGLFEEFPLKMWMICTAPMTTDRSKEEVRARTLVGAVECLRAGITTVQDMLGLMPRDNEYVDVVLAAYEEVGIRVVFSPMVQDIPAVEAALYFDEMLPPEVKAMVGDKAPTGREQLDFLETQLRRHPAGDRLHWAVGPSAPQRCTRDLLEGCADLAARHHLPVYSHVYETKSQALMAREAYADYGGSLIGYLDDVGLLNPGLTIAHSVWINRAEMDRMAEADAGIVLNHLSNFKLKSGIAPVCDLREAGVRLALGCDNCSGSDVQNMFQAMKIFCLIAAVSEPMPGPPLAHEALRMATLGSARTAGLDDTLGAIRPGMKADLMLLDLDDTAYLPFNSAARQLVYSETGRGIETVIVDGRIAMKNREILTVDEDALRQEVRGLMRDFVVEFENVVRTRKTAMSHLLDAHKRVWQADVGLQRFLSRTQ
jgi:cytosine/adenosine deaminase-related metal-dependent hydrolase